jgi:hypothetical protein
MTGPVLTPAQWEHALALTLSGDPFERRGAMAALRAHEEACRERLAEARADTERLRQVQRESQSLVTGLLREPGDPQFEFEVDNALERLREALAAKKEQP